jgi:hypothetical protein
MQLLIKKITEVSPPPPQLCCAVQAYLGWWSNGSRLGCHYLRKDNSLVWSLRGAQLLCTPAGAVSTQAAGLLQPNLPPGVRIVRAP